MDIHSYGIRDVYGYSCGDRIKLTDTTALARADDHAGLLQHGDARGDLDTAPDVHAVPDLDAGADLDALGRDGDSELHTDTDRDPESVTIDYAGRGRYRGGGDPHRVCSDRCAVPGLLLPDHRARALT